MTNYSYFKQSSEKTIAAHKLQVKSRYKEFKSRKLLNAEKWLTCLEGNSSCLILKAPKEGRESSRLRIKRTFGI